MPENEESGHAATHLDMNWRQVWFWSAVLSAPLSALITFGILGDLFIGPAAYSFQDFIVMWTAFTILLTPVGALAVFRATFDPAEEFAERQRARQKSSENSPVAAATKQILTGIAKALGRASNCARS